MRFFVLLLSIFSFVPSGSAEEYDLLGGNIFDLELGPGYGGGERYRVNGSKKAYQGGSGHGFIPFYYFRLGPIHLSNTYSLDGFRHSDKSRLRLGGIITYTGERYRANGLSNRNESFFGGGFIGYGPLSIYGYTDMMKESSGTIYGIRFAPLIYKTAKGGWFLVFEGEQWSNNFVNYYFGVRSTEASSTLPAYVGKKEIKGSVALVFAHQISESWRFIFWSKENYYGDRIVASPTVGRRYQFLAGLGWLYKFF